MSAGVLLTAFGGPTCLDEVGPFMHELMRRPPSEELVERVKERYAAIGGCSPLPGMAESIATALSDELARRGLEAPVRLGLRYSPPRIADAVGDLRSAGASTIVHLTLSPFESEMSSGSYRRAVAEASRGGGTTVIEAPGYHVEPQLIEVLVHHGKESLETLFRIPRLLLFTAHSLPLDDLDEAGTYVAQVRETAEAVAAGLGLDAGSVIRGRLGGDDVFGSLEIGSLENSPRTDREDTLGSSAPCDWAVVYQSKGRRPGEWLGPQLDDVLHAAAAEGYRSVCVSPVGFVTDHMETLYDVDVVAAGQAERAGLSFARADVLNDDPRFVSVLADIAEGSL